MMPTQPTGGVSERRTQFGWADHVGPETDLRQRFGEGPFVSIYDDSRVVKFSTPQGSVTLARHFFQPLD